MNPKNLKHWYLKHWGHRGGFRRVLSARATLSLLIVLGGLASIGCTKKAPEAPAAAMQDARYDVWAQKPVLQGEWNTVKTEGEEGEMVAVVFEDGWKIVGERVSGYSLYPEAIPFQVAARKVEDVPMYPCMDCHAKRKSDPTPRTVQDKHKGFVLKHDPRTWCLECHNSKDMNTLNARVDGQVRVVDMDLSYLLCSQCHFRQAKDWHYGGHGKRIGMWREPRVLRNCVECHPPHSPSIKPDKPAPPPLARTGLEHQVAKPSPWRRPWEDHH